MKITQAYTWLAAGVLAAGLNASYHGGGLQRVHEVVERAEQNSTAVLTVVSGHADQVLSEMRWVTARQETASCPLSMALARVENRLAQSELAHSQLGKTEFAMAELPMAELPMTELARNQARLDRIEAMADREQARIEVNRARIEAQAARVRIPAMAFKTMVFSAPGVECARVRVSMPRLPRIRVPEIPVIRVETGLGGPI